MSHDTSPKELPKHAPTADAAERKPQPTLSREKRAQINRELELPENGLCVAVATRPGGGKFLTIVELPRSSSGRPPRRGVHIPLPPMQRCPSERLSKHGRQQTKGDRRHWERPAKAKAAQEVAA